MAAPEEQGYLPFESDFLAAVAREAINSAMNEIGRGGV